MLIQCLHAGTLVRSNVSRTSTLSRTSSGSGGAQESRVSVGNTSTPLSRTSSSNGSVQSYGSARSNGSALSNGSARSNESARSNGSGMSGGSGLFAPRQTSSRAKTVWVWTESKDVMSASIEGGWSTSSLHLRQWTLPINGYVGVSAL